MIRSFVKWAGGKSRITYFLEKFAPESIDRYVEPFLGSAAFFFYLAQIRPKFKAILSDSNADLVNVYKCVRDDVHDLIDVLRVHQANYSQEPEKYYYHIRDIYVPEGNLESAARLLFLNKTCYNGLYRVNRSGQFNVPHGTYVNPTICNRGKLLTASEILRTTDAEIVHAHYGDITAKCQKGDFVYLDPPYFPLTKTASFKDYTKENFGYYEQIKLADEFKRLALAGCIVLLSNSDSALIKDLYKEFHIMRVGTERLINRNGSDRRGHKELLITNRKLNLSEVRQRYAEKVR